MLPKATRPARRPPAFSHIWEWVATWTWTDILNPLNGWRFWGIQALPTKAILFSRLAPVFLSFIYIFFFFYSSLPSSADAAPGSPPAANKTRTSAVYKPPHCIFSLATSQQDAKHCTATATKVDGSSTQATLEGPTGLPFYFFLFFPPFIWRGVMLDYPTIIKFRCAAPGLRLRMKLKFIQPLEYHFRF